MEKEFVTYEIGLELKQLGFDESCFAYYEDGVFIHWYDSKQENELLLNCTTPTYSQAFRWFREKYDLFHSINYQDDNSGPGSFDYEILNKRGKSQCDECPEFNTYEEAELACLQKLIEIVKTK